MVREFPYPCEICGKEDAFKNLVVAHMPPDHNGYCVIETYCVDCYGDATTVKKKDSKRCRECGKSINVDRDECVVVTKPGKRTNLGYTDVFCLDCYREYVDGRRTTVKAFDEHISK